jgi:glutathione S-transferase
MPSYKLIYFDGRGRGEICRYLLAAAGVDFEDQRLTYATWPAIKPTVPYNGLPCLVEDDNKLGQSLAIQHYIAQRYGLLGDTAWEAAVINMIVNGMAAQHAAAMPITMAMITGKGEEGMKAACLDYLAGAWNVHVQRTEQQLADNGGEWLVGNRMSMADIAVAEWTDRFVRFDPRTFDGHPALLAHHARVHAVPNIAAYVKHRPDRPF